MNFIEKWPKRGHTTVLDYFQFLNLQLRTWFLNATKFNKFNKVSAFSPVMVSAMAKILKLGKERFQLSLQRIFNMNSG